MSAAAAMLRDLADRAEIANLLARHSRGVDRADTPLLRSAYADGGEVAYGFFTGPADAFAGILAGAQKAGAVTMHRTSNMWIALAGDEAVSESYVTAYTQSAEAAGPIQRLILGRYLDRHVRTGGGWRIAHRAYVLESNLNWPGASAWPEPPPGHTQPRGGHGGADIGVNLIALWQAAPARPTGDRPAMTASEETTLDALVSRQAIHELMMAYCRAADRGDEALMRSLFHDDATVVAGVSNGPAAVFAGEVVARIRGGLKSAFHSLANEWIEVDGETAVAESYVIAFTLAGEGAQARQGIVGGRYLDRFARRAGAWKIAARVFVMDFNIDQPSTAQFGEGMYESLTTRGGFAPDDPVYAFWQGAGAGTPHH